WQRRLDPDTGYTVRGACQFLTSVDLVTMDDSEHLIWHPQLTFAYLDVGMSRRPITYSSHAALLVLFGL
ncbi:hypothetical protein A2U01_0056788, partial [Trifolium medium]|nr:hypothetical protein [Trifolium medium]